MKTIGGPVRYDLLADRARLLHRPTTVEGMRTAALDLAASGLTPGDIGIALGISAAAVEQLLQDDQVKRSKAQG